MNGGGVNESENELWVEAEGEHKRDDRGESKAFAGSEVGEGGPAAVERAGEDLLDDSEDDDGGDHEAYYGDGCGPGDEGEGAFEDEELADEAVEAGEPEGGEKRDAHEAGKDGGDFAEAAEVVEGACAVAALLNQGDEPEDGGGGEAVVEHLEDDAVHGGEFLRGERRVSAGELRDGEDGEQAVAEVVDRGIGEDALEVFLREGGVGGEDDRRDGQPEQGRQYGPHLREKDGEQDAEEAVESHLRHRSGQQDGGAGGGFGVGGGEPGVERNERYFDGESQERSEEDEECEVVREEVVVGEVRCHCRHQRIGLRELGEFDEVEVMGREEDG